MKRLKKYWLLLMVAPFLVATCMTIEEIIHPDNATVDSDIEIVVRIKIDAETDGNSKLAFGVLAPKSWDIAHNATLTLTTTADFPANVVNESMTVIPASETNPSDALSWPASFQSKFGVLGNTGGPVEWVVFESNTTFQIHDKDNGGAQKVVNGTVRIRLHTGPRATKLFMGYAFRGKANLEHNGDAVKEKMLEVTGGDDPLWDYTIEAPISYVPATFGFGDIFAIKYNEPNSTVGGLKGGNVYLQAKAVYTINGGVQQEKTVDEISSKTLMDELGDTGQVTSWQKYIYPKDFFDLPDNAEIIEIHVQFTNQDESIVIDNDFIVEPTCE
jgi:hypothetical protein